MRPAIPIVTQAISMCCLPVVPVVAALAVERSGIDRVIPDAFTRGTEQE